MTMMVLGVLCCALGGMCHARHGDDDDAQGDDGWR